MGHGLPAREVVELTRADAVRDTDMFAFMVCIFPACLAESDRKCQKVIYFLVFGHVVLVVYDGMCTDYYV